MKKAYIFLGVAIAILVYFLTKKSNSTLVGVTGANGNSILDSVLGMNKTDTSNTTDTNTITPLATNLLAYKYKGQAVYGTYNGVTKSSDSLGFTYSGYEIKLSGIVYDSASQSYIDKPITSNDNGTTVLPVGVTLPQQYLYNGQTLYYKYNGVTVPTGGLGYLSDGTVIYVNNVIFLNGQYTDRNGQNIV